jgi:cbb3-type cytochrome oxidase subunit 3
MSLQNLIGTITTVLSFAAFLAVLWWTLGRSRRERFAAAAQAPFALPDDLQPADPSIEREA